MTDDELAGPCQCALASVAGAVPAVQLDGLEDGFRESGEFPIVIRRAIADCQGARAARIDAGAVAALAEACSFGDDRLADPCRCAADRAALIVPAGGLATFDHLTDVSPNLIDLLNRCLGT